MIKMIASVYGLPIENADGTIRVVGMGPESGAFSIDEKREAELVAQGIAVYVGESEDDAPIGFNDVPPTDGEDDIRDLTELNANELRELGKEYGLSFPVGTRKVDMIAEITKAQAEEGESEDDAPTFDAEDAVQ